MPSSTCNDPILGQPAAAALMPTIVAATIPKRKTSIAARLIVRSVYPLADDMGRGRYFGCLRRTDAVRLVTYASEPSR